MELAGAAALLAFVLLPAGSGEDIGLGLLYVALFFGGIALWLTTVLVVVVLAVRKTLKWRDTAWLLALALIPLFVTIWTIQLYF